MPTETLPLLEQRLLAIPNDREQGAAFERALVAWINAGQHKELQRAWMWSDWPERTARGLGVDKGIDIVAESVDGALVAIQVKFRRDPDDPVTAPEVQKLVGAYRKHFQLFALASNAWSATRGVEETVGPEAMLILREDLLASDYDWAAQKSVPAVPFTPFAFQLEAAENIRAALADGGRAQIVMACGTGKTVTMLLAMEALDAERVLVLAPTLLLVKQLRDEWVAKRRENRPWASLAVCSDIGKDYDATDLSPAELGVPATTDPARVATFLRGPGRRVVFSTYASSDRIAQAQRDPEVPAFDLAVADEAHRVAGVVAARNAGERSQRVVLEDTQIRAARRLFATATPRVTGAARTRDGDEVLIESMDDPARFGPVVHSVTFQQAVALDRLVPYKLIVTVVTEGEVAEAIRDRSFVDVDGATFPADTVATAVALRRAYDELGITRMISYHARVEAARAFAALIRRVPGPGAVPTTEHVAGTMPVNDRKRVLRRLAEATGPYLVTNARCLTEGIDVPALDAVAFADPRRSQVDIVQAVGRAMRRPAGGSAKTTGYIVLPVYLTTAELDDPEAAVEGTAFEPVLRVLRALKDHDPFMARFMAKVLVEAGERPAARGEGIDEILQVSLGKALDRVLAERLLAAVRLQAIEVAADPFERNLELLRRFVEREGHARVPQKHVEEGVRLGAWVTNQRQRRESLSGEQIESLSALGFVWNVLEDQFDRNLGLLRLFIEREGHALVLASHVEEGVALGAWVSRLRSSTDALAQDRLERLTEAGFVWDVGEHNYLRNLELLRRYVLRTGTALVPSTWTEDSERLGIWVVGLRRRKERLTERQIAELDALGFVWEPIQDSFERGMRFLERFVQREGHARIPRDWKEDGLHLGNWVVTIRSNRERMPQERVNRLNALGFSWDPRRDDFARNLQLLEIFVEREGHARVPQAWVEAGENLGSWVSTLRQKRERLGDEDVVRLNALGFVWEAAEDQFERNVAALRSFVRREGHARVPPRHVENGFGLGSWVRTVRGQRKSLSPDRASVLNGLGFVWDPREDRWGDCMRALVEFVAREGHARVPDDWVEGDLRLGTWVGSLRSRRDGLSDTQVEELDAVGFVWDPFQEQLHRNMSLLSRFVAREGHARVPVTWVEDGVRLGSWVSGLRGRRGRLESEVLQQLDALGFIWNTFDEQFLSMLEVFGRYVQRTGHARVPAKWVEDGVKLGLWVSNLRAKRSTLPPERIAQLDALGFVWSVKPTK